ncbi:MAG TPA: DUF3858 domain-containing protein [Saprospiraceae bacterium]|nr:DUF3858 domain-containing protein [Saprospiraceae bacterium]
MKRNLILCLILLCPLWMTAQATLKVEFGNVSAADFDNTSYPLDPDAGAVVIFDKGQLDFVSDSKGWFDLRLRRHCRIHILKNNGFEAATIGVPLYHRGKMEERINQIKAVTYSMENGKMVKTEMKNDAIFKVKHNKNWEETKFTLPNVKEGVIIEFEYQVKSDYFYIINPWMFQGSFPVLWSELTFEVPQFFGYVSSLKGIRNVDYQKSREINADFTLNVAEGVGQAADWVTISCKASEIIWGMKDVIGLNTEPLISSLENYKSGIGFQLSEFKDPLKYKKITSDWDKFNKELLENEDFGKEITGRKSMVEDILTEMNVQSENPKEKAKKIYDYIRDHFQVIPGSGIEFRENVKSVITSKSGRANEINLLLVAVLRQAQLEADPVIYSTRENGLANPFYPLASDYDGVLCRLNLDGKKTILDASVPLLGFGKTTPAARNGYARVIGQIPEAIEISPDSIMEKETVFVKMAADDENNWLGTMEYKASATNSHQLRVKHNLDAQKIAGSFAIGLEEDNIISSRVDSLKKWDEPMLVSFKFKQFFGEDSFIYVNPFQFALTRENVFKSKDRTLPVEFSNLVEENYICSMSVPKGYAVVSLPKNQSFAIDEQNSLTFEIRCSEAAGQVSVRSKLKINKSTFPVDEYPALKETLDFVVNRHNEQIVFKKL